jgi:hypothetical protein
MARRLRARVLTGDMPAEALDRHDGDIVLTQLWQGGHTDTEIATRTQWSTYTVARKRSRLGLAANGERREAVA